MALRDILIFAAIATLAFSGLYYGYRFLRMGNVLLGWEWIILGSSASNMFLLYATGWPASEAVMLFFDSFSRSVGIPIIGTFGLLKVINGGEPPRWLEILLFVGGGIAAYVFVTTPSLQDILPGLYLVLGLCFSATLIHMSWLLLRAGEAGHAIALATATVAMFVIAVLEGMVAIPGDATNLVLNFYFIAHIGWALSFAEIFFACRALLRARGRRSGFSGDAVIA